MKQKGKKAVGLVACSMLFAMTAISLAACGGEKHNLKEYSEKAATCTEAGYKHHYVCSDCGKYYEDAEAKKELSESDVIIPAKDHNPTERKAKDATCFEDGYSQDHWYCANGCGTVWSDNGNTVMTDTDDLIVPATEHKGTISHVEGTPATTTAAGVLEHWHCTLCNSDYETEFGDNKLESTVIPQIVEKTANVNVAVYDKTDALVTDTSAVKVTLTGELKTYSEVTIANGKLALDKMYEGEYTVTATGYTPMKITVKENAAVELILVAEFVENSNPNNNEKGTVSWSVQKTESGISKTVTLNTVDVWDAAQLEGDHTEAKMLLTDEQKIADGYVLYTTVKFRNTKGEKGATDRGGFLLTKNAADDGKDYGGFVFYNEDNGIHNMQRNNEHGVTLNQDNKLTYYDLYTALGAGMQVRIVKAGKTISLSVLENGKWKTLCKTTCKTDDINDIRFLGSSGQWEYSDIRLITANTVKNEKPTQIGATFVADHILLDGEYYTPAGEKTSLEALTLKRSEITYNVAGYRNGDSVDFTSGTLHFTNDAIDHSFDATIGNNGMVTITVFAATDEEYSGDYIYEIDGDEYFGTLEILEDVTNIMLEYKYAADTGMSDYNAWVALDSMNDASHTISMGADNGRPTDKYSEVTLNLPDEIKNSHNVTLTFTLKFDDEFTPHMRVGAMMVNNKGVSMGLFSTETLQVIPLTTEGKNGKGVFDGGDNANDKYSGAVTKAVLSTDGLQVRFLRTGDKIRMFAFFNNEWVELRNVDGVVTCDADAETDIRLLALSGNWTFSNIAYSTVTVTPAVEADTTKDGNLAYIKIGEQYFKEDGPLTTWDDLFLPKHEKLTSATLVLKDSEGNFVPEGTEVVLECEIASGPLTVLVGKNGTVTLSDTTAVYKNYKYRVTADCYFDTHEVIWTTGTECQIEDLVMMKVGVEMTMEGISDGTNFDFDSHILNGREILGYQRYAYQRGNFGSFIGGDASLFGKVQGDNLIDMTHRLGGDFGGSTTAITFTARGITDASNAWLGTANEGSNPNSGSVLVNVTKECSYIVLFTGTYMPGLFDMTVTDTTLNRQLGYYLYRGKGANDARGNMLLIKLNTKNLQEGESYPVELHISGAHLMFAACAVLGAETTSVTPAEQKVSATMALSRVEYGSSINLDADVLNGREIIAWQRYSMNGNNYEKDSNNIISDDGILTYRNRYGNDYHGDKTPITFTARGLTNSDCGFFSGANPASGYITVKVDKNCKQLLFYTGAFRGYNPAVNFYVYVNGERIAAQSYSGRQTVSGVDEMSHLITVTLDTSKLAEGETVDVTFTADNTDECKFAAFVVLGNESASSEYQKKISATSTITGIRADSATEDMNIDLDSGVLDGKNILAFQRYSNTYGYEKDDNNLLGNDGFMDMKRVGADYAGSTTAVTFTADGKTDGGCRFTGTGGDGNAETSYVTIRVTKGVTKIVLYTGTYEGDGLERWFNLTEKGILVKTEKYNGKSGDFATYRPVKVEFTLDTSALGDDESVELVLSLGGRSVEVAAVVLLGADVQA